MENQIDDQYHEEIGKEMSDHFAIQGNPIETRAGSGGSLL